ncbi:MAG: HAD family hydrolase [Chloroflexi bacterium]|nr:HAD family hydrolase [Chloroflexota bacterium]
MKLIIFDMDQTLVDFIPVHDEVARRLFRKFFDVEARLTEIDFAGRGLADNFTELARLKNVPPEGISARSKELLEYYDAVFGELIPKDGTKYILPGVEKLLDELSRTDNIVVLYTGDSPAIVNHVFKSTGLGKYFKFHFFGTEVKTRADMVRQAIEKAEELTGKTFRSRDIVVIGDSVRDVECGKQFNALTIAVGTGFHSKEKLLSTNPDYFFKDLSDYKKVLEAIGAN